MRAEWGGGPGHCRPRPRRGIVGWKPPQAASVVQEILCQFEQSWVWKNPAVLSIVTTVRLLLEPDFREWLSVPVTPHRQVLPALAPADS